MRIKYSRLAKLFGLVALFVFIVPFFMKSIDKPSLRSSDDIERQIDLVFKHDSNIGADGAARKKDVLNAGDQSVRFVILRFLILTIFAYYHRFFLE